MTDGTYFHLQSGSNSVSYYNANFASVSECTDILGALPDPPNTLTATRKYGCRYTDASATPLFMSTPVTDVGPGPTASGTITVTDTTLTGTLTINDTTDEPRAGTIVTVGNGPNGYNLRAYDGHPFGNSWNGATTLGTYTLNLTGTFTATSWHITGGTARFADAGFLCQQGGNSVPTNILCSASTQAGGHQSDGAALSWGWDPDGSGPNTTMGEIEVHDNADVTIETLSGVLANLSVDGLGNITTNQGEIRRALGSSSCSGASIRWSGTHIVCGRLTVANLIVSGGILPSAADEGPIAATESVGQVIPVGANDVGFTDPITVTVTTPPTKGTITAISPPGMAAGMTITYTANVGEAGVDTFIYQVTDSNAASDLGAVTLIVGLVPDAVPEVFTFIDDANAAMDTPITSNTIAVAGINVPTAISVVGGEYSINGGAFTALTGTVYSGNMVRVRQTSSANPSIATDATVTIGGVADTFTVNGVDSDGDGVSDATDNCTLVANAAAGTVPGTSIPRFQLDSDNDGYGNACDADLNNTGVTTAADYNILRTVIGKTYSFSPNAARSDLNSSGAVTTADFAMLRARISTPPGPSGLPCAGGIPCQSP
ncbi:MAG: dockerin type I domain-containing protein [Gammaproteobacteria bacterium]